MLSLPDSMAPYTILPSRLEEHRCFNRSLVLFFFLPKLDARMQVALEGIAGIYTCVGLELERERY
jgi:hypothetical protein